MADEADADYYAVKESETPEGEGPKFPIGDCDDVEDAWNLRGQPDYSKLDVTRKQVAQRIVRRGNDLDCPDRFKPWKS